MENDYRVKIKFVVTIVFFLLITPQCFWTVSQDVNCKATLNLSIINNSEDTLFMKFVDKHSDKDLNHISFENDSVFLSPQTRKNTKIEYVWLGNQECFFSYEFYKSRYKSIAEMRMKDSILPEINIFPWDTATKFVRICTCSTYVYFDTIIVP